MKKWYKLCPYCGEEIIEFTEKCNHCWTTLSLTGEKSNKILGNKSEKKSTNKNSRKKYNEDWTNKTWGQYNQTGTDWFDRLLFLIPNIIILWFILQFIRTMIWTIDYGINPHSIMYKHPIYFRAYSILSIISVFVWIFMLSIPTRKKIYTLSFSLIWWSILILFIIYSILWYWLKEKQEQQQLRQKEIECRMKWYSSCAEMQSELRKKFKEFNPTNSSQETWENQKKTYVIG